MSGRELRLLDGEDEGCRVMGETVVSRGDGGGTFVKVPPRPLKTFGLEGWLVVLKVVAGRCVREWWVDGHKWLISGGKGVADWGRGWNNIRLCVKGGGKLGRVTLTIG